MKAGTAIIVCLVMVLGSATAGAGAGGGAGARESPRAVTLIHDVFELQNVSYDGDYALANDIDASETRGWNGGTGFSPLCWQDPFQGWFDGRGYTISGLFINRSMNAVGLFANVDSLGQVSGVNLLMPDITGMDYVGALAGVNSGQITDCAGGGSVKGSDYIGGLVGQHRGGHMYGCTSSASARGETHVGGLVGSLTDAELSHGRSTGVVNGTYNVGGLAGSVFRSTVTASLSASPASGEMNIGGFVGNSNPGTIRECWSVGPASGSQRVGGFVGFQNIGETSDCYSTGPVDGNSLVGGFAGFEGAIVRSCFSSGKVSGNASVGGFMANLPTIIPQDCHWDTETSAQNASPAGIGNTTVEMMRKATFTGWDFEKIWDIIEGESYPFLRAFYSPPEITASDVNTATEDIPYSARYGATFSAYPDINRPGWSFSTGASGWLAFDDGTGTLSGTPDNGDVGPVWVNITVRDSVGHSDFRNFTIEVRNAPPAFTAVPQPGTTVAQGEHFSFDIGCDDEGQGRTAYLAELLPGWLSIDGATGNLSGTPGNADFGANLFLVTADDGNGGRTDLLVEIEVTDVNDAPVITTAGLPQAFEGRPYFFLLEAPDIDPAPDILNWTLLSGPAWLALDSVTGLLLGLPGEQDIGSSGVSVTVDDGRGGTDGRNFTLEVLNLNDAPVWASFPGDQSVIEGQPLRLQVLATDPDAGDTVRYSITSEPPSNITIDAASGAISWPAAAPGNFSVNVTATDGKLAIRKAFGVTVSPAAPLGRPGGTAGTGGTDGYSWGWLLAMLVVGLLAGALAVFALLRGSRGGRSPPAGGTAWTPTAPPPMPTQPPQPGPPGMAPLQTPQPVPPAPVPNQPPQPGPPDLAPVQPAESAPPGTGGETRPGEFRPVNRDPPPP